MGRFLLLAGCLVASLCLQHHLVAWVCVRDGDNGQDYIYKVAKAGSDAYPHIWMEASAERTSAFIPFAACLLLEEIAPLVPYYFSNPPTPHT